MSVAIGVNNYQTNPYMNQQVYPNKIRVNEKFSAFVLVVDQGHDISMSYGTDGANGWESTKMQSFSEVSFSTPGRHLIYATMACKQTGTTKSVSFYIDVI
ncbi:hypothetical protein G9F71_003470 [Clostridium sp. FP2]|uniref:hypothetical protein n=1 Tax=Clostridium sp. FP2 TaxID=2724481 RepID=UPI0013E95BEE|nr:hypothetical protein [Clostridium sp. FP2]MBZ9621915.1 hypothetical protein [Clostridium sp. FP2]